VGEEWKLTTLRNSHRKEGEKEKRTREREEGSDRGRHIYSSSPSDLACTKDAASIFQKVFYSKACYLSRAVFKAFIHFICLKCGSVMNGMRMLHDLGALSLSAAYTVETKSNHSG
jgi:hypothetical protein